MRPMGSSLSPSLHGRPRTMATRVATGRLWPSGEWTLGSKAVGQTDDRLDDRELTYCSPGDEWMFGLGGGVPDPLNLGDVTNSHTRAKRGRKGITARGRRMVRSAGALINRYYPHHRKTFCTVTVPVLSPEGNARLVSNWAELIRQLIQYLSRKLQVKALPKVVISVSEIQPKRLESRHEAYLHLHLLWLNVPGRGHWTVRTMELKAWVSSALERLAGEPLPCEPNIRTDEVKGKVASYMSKYMSKGGSDLDSALEQWGEDNHPATWWNMSQTARDWVKAETREGEPVGEYLEYVRDWALAGLMNDALHWIHPIEIEREGQRFVAGWKGCFTDDFYERAIALLKST